MLYVIPDTLLKVSLNTCMTGMVILVNTATLVDRTSVQQEW